MVHHTSARSLLGFVRSFSKLDLSDPLTVCWLPSSSSSSLLTPAAMSCAGTRSKLRNADRSAVTSKEHSDKKSHQPERRSSTVRTCAGTHHSAFMASTGTSKSDVVQGSTT